jgi:non-heme chloroperoxidase
LLIHGWSQSHLSWAKQCEKLGQKGHRIVALDLRGHGMSDAPLQPAQYVDGNKWADDIAAVIEQVALEKPILVGWSYGGYVVLDYVHKYGQDKIAGINFVAAAVVLGKKAFGSLIGPGLLENAPGACQVDLPTNIAAIRNFLYACTAKPMGRDHFEVMLAYNMVVHPLVRAFLLQRELDFTPVIAGLTVPVLATHGRSDIVVLPAMSEHILEHCKAAQVSWFNGVGHAPFLEEPDRFNQELIAFAGWANG